MLDLKIFLFENKLSFIFKNFSFDLLLQSNFRKKGGVKLSPLHSTPLWTSYAVAHKLDTVTSLHYYFKRHANYVLHNASWKKILAH